MKKLNKLIIACDGESASGKSTAAKLISKKYKLLLVNSGLLYRYASKLLINNNPKNQVTYLRKKFDNVSYQNITSYISSFNANSFVILYNLFLKFIYNFSYFFILS